MPADGSRCVEPEAVRPGVFPEVCGVPAGKLDMIDLQTSRTGRLLGAGLLCCVAACSTADADRSEAGAYQPAQDVPRLGGAPLAGDDIGIVRDFDVAGDTIY